MGKSKSLARSIGRQALERAGIEVNDSDLGSELEGDFATAIGLAKITGWQREVRCLPKRSWRSDFVWEVERVIVECEGGTFSGGRHTRGKGFEEDCRKYAELILAGWLVLRVTGAHIASGEAVQWVERALALRKPPAARRRKAR